MCYPRHLLVYDIHTRRYACFRISAKTRQSLPVRHPGPHDGTDSTCLPRALSLLRLSGWGIRYAKFVYHHR
jgi:hypothetical protein